MFHWYFLNSVFINIFYKKNDRAGKKDRRGERVKAGGIGRNWSRLFFAPLLLLPSLSSFLFSFSCSLFCNHLSFFFRFQFRSSLLFFFPFFPLTVPKPFHQLHLLLHAEENCCFTSATLGFRPIGILSLLFSLFHLFLAVSLYSNAPAFPNGVLHTSN